MILGPLHLDTNINDKGIHTSRCQSNYGVCNALQQQATVGMDIKDFLTAQDK